MLKNSKKRLTNKVVYLTQFVAFYLTVIVKKINKLYSTLESDHTCISSHEDQGDEYPHWPCGNLIFKYITKPKDWLQGG